MANVKKIALIALTALVASMMLVAVPASAQDVRLKDITRVQGVTSNQLVGYGLVTGLAGTGDSTSVAFTSKTIQNVLHLRPLDDIAGRAYAQRRGRRRDREPAALRTLRRQYRCDGQLDR